VKTTLAFAALLAFAPPTLAKEVVHVVGPGETLSDVADRYWGESGWADLLRTHNELRTRSAPRGTRLRVPMPVERAVKANDTWASIGKSALGDSAYGPLVARLNRRDASVKPKAGETVRVPVPVNYRLGKGETLASLARRFLSGTRDWPLLAKLNSIQNPSRLRAGASLRIPVVPRTTPAKIEPPRPAVLPMPPSAPAPVAAAPAPLPETPARIKAIQKAAINSYFEGNYEEARDQMEALRPEMFKRGTTEDQVELLEHLTFVYVAFDNEKSACSSYRALLARRPHHRWDADQVSPKVSRTTSLCER
jgi:LysM repeat protein